ncbi:MAG TPA: TonB-dependent receptor [Burkholderiaceae bacterium]|jgi:vitamin B12 transporter
MFKNTSHAGCVLAAFALLPMVAAAQATLDQVIVTGTREAQPLRNSTADVVLIDADTIRDSGMGTIEDLLRAQAGLQVARNGGPGQSSGYFMRGTGTSSTVVLIDGVRVGSASLGQAELESISLAQVDHIEVLRGPASSLYGADAVGGVIQIFTRRGTEGTPRVTGNLAVGGYGSSDGNVSVSGAQGGFDYAASIGQERSDGVSTLRPNDQFGNYNPDKDGFKRTVGSAQLGFTPAAGHRIGINISESKLNGQYDGSQYLPPDYTADATPDFRNHLKTDVAAINYRGEISSFWTTTLQVSSNTDDSRSGGTVLARYKTERDQYTWQNALHFSPDQQVVLAYEHLKDSVAADDYGTQYSRNNNALVAGYSGRFGDAGLEASVRHDDNSVYGGNTTGSLGASYALNSKLKLRALVGTSFRAPAFNDLFYPGYGISTLQPERGRSAEIGLAWQAGGSSASATVYRNKVRNLIGYDPDPNGTDCPAGYFGCAGNTSRAKLQGATLSAGQRWGGLNLRANVDLLDARDENSGARLARRAAHQESLMADYDAGNWTVGASLVDVGARPDGSANLGAYALIDVRATWHFLPQWRLEAKVLNVADRDTQPVRDYQGLGRQAWIGLRFDSKGL